MAACDDSDICQGLVFYPDGRIESKLVNIEDLDQVIGTSIEGSAIEPVGEFEKLALFCPERMTKKMSFNENASDIYNLLKRDDPDFWRESASVLRGICVLVDDDCKLTLDSWNILSKEILHRKMIIVTEKHTNGNVLIIPPSGEFRLGNVGRDYNWKNLKQRPAEEDSGKLSLDLRKTRKKPFIGIYDPEPIPLELTKCYLPGFWIMNNVMYYDKNSVSEINSRANMLFKYASRKSVVFGEKSINGTVYIISEDDNPFTLDMWNGVWIEFTSLVMKRIKKLIEQGEDDEKLKWIGV